MTTGRINQVTIFDPSALRRQGTTPRKGGRVYKAGSWPEGQLQSHAAKVHKTPTLRGDSIQLPPLSSPRDGPGRNLVGGEHHQKRPVPYIPQEEKTHSRLNTRYCADIRRGHPQRFVGFLAKPTIHRPQTVPAGLKTSRASVARHPFGRNTQARSSGVKPTRTGGEQLPRPR